MLNAVHPHSDMTRRCIMHLALTACALPASGAISAPVTNVPKMAKAVAMPPIGFGTFNNFEEPERVEDAVRSAIKKGYRMIDCARFYGNEKYVGRAIRAAIDAGEVERKELFVCSKLWNADAAPEDVEPACRTSLADLQLDYLDCYYMHWPVQMTPDSGSDANSKGRFGGVDFKLVHKGDCAECIRDTYAAMEKCADKGLAQHLGVSNFDECLLDDLLAHCTRRPIANQIELHPYLAQKDLVAYLQNEGIRPVAYAPLGSSGGDNGGPNLLKDPVITSIAEDLGKSTGQVILRWGVQRGTSVIPKSLTEKRMDQNLDITSWSLTEAQMDQVNGLDRGLRFVRPPYFDFDENKCASP